LKKESEKYAIKRSAKGKIDLADKDDIIVDRKITKRSMPAENIAGSFQLTCYALAYRQGIL